jgi:FtsH-binding integral membrane protein
MKIFSFDIIVNHYSTFVNSEEKPEFLDWVVMIVLPCLVSFFLTITDVKLSDTAVIGLLTVGAILTGLLLNLLVLIYDQKSRLLQSEPKSEDFGYEIWQLRKKLVDEVHYNIGYAIWLSLLGLVFATTASFQPKLEVCLPFLEYCFSAGLWLVTFPTYFIFLHLALTIFMVLKRVYLLVASE